MPEIKYKKIKYDSKNVQVQSAIEDKDGNDIVLTYSTKDELETKQDKLPEKINDNYLHVNETTGDIEWKAIQSGGSKVGDIISSTILDTMAKVIEQYGGTYWELLSDETGVYQWKRTDEEPPVPLYFIALEPNVSISSSMFIGGPGIELNIHLQVSRDGETWEDAGDEYGRINDPIILENTGDKLFVKNLTNTFSEEEYAAVHFIFEGNVAVGGELISLINFSPIEEGWGRQQAFCKLFADCATLIDAQELIFPETTVTNYQTFYEMFSGCASLQYAPKVSQITTFGSDCCVRMFEGCSMLNISEDSGDHELFVCPNTIPSDHVSDMFTNTTGSFNGTPIPGHTYYWND